MKDLPFIIELINVVSLTVGLLMLAASIRRHRGKRIRIKRIFKRIKALIIV